MYPKTKKIKNDASMVSCNYECESTSQCDFSQCFTCIDSHPDLRDFSSQRVLKNIVHDFETYSKDHMSSILDGFQVGYRGGIDLIRLQRVENGVPCKKSRTGFLEYNNIRDDNNNERLKLNTINSGISKSLQVVSYCSIQ